MSARLAVFTVYVYVSCAGLIGAVDAEKPEEISVKQYLNYVEEKFRVKIDNLLPEDILLRLVPLSTREHRDAHAALIDLCDNAGVLYNSAMDHSGTVLNVVIARQQLIRMEMTEMPLAVIIDSVRHQVGRSGLFVCGQDIPSMRLSVKVAGVPVSDALRQIAELSGGYVVPVRVYGAVYELTDVSWFISWSERSKRKEP